MPKKRLIQISKELDISFEKAMDLVDNKLSSDMVSGKQRATWITEEGQVILGEAAYIEEIVPKHFKGWVIKPALNPNYVFAEIKEIGEKVAVSIPRRYRGKLIHKNIMIHGIEDENGTSYRYPG
jgi:putative transposon-encoded protein